MHTKAVYQHDSSIQSLITQIVSVQPLDSISTADRALFKHGSDGHHVVVTTETIFYAQGGGQPSDTGTIRSADTDQDPIRLEVLQVRHGSKGQILHLGRFVQSTHRVFAADESVVQDIDGQKRDLHSCLHTAGHIVGLAVRQLELHDVRELKASHYPEAAFVEFHGFIDGKHKLAIQERADEMVARALPVRVCWLSDEELRRNCVVVPDNIGTVPGELARAVDIQGVGAYPCGGTQVADTSRVGKVVIRKISRQKGNSKCSYSVV